MHKTNGAEEEEQGLDAEVRRQVIGLLIAVIGTFFIAGSAYAFFLLNAEAACALASSNVYLGLWPPNFRDADILARAGYAAHDSCILLSTRSIISGAMLAYVVYLLISQIWVRDRRYIPNIIFIAIALTSIYAWTSTKPISTEPASIYSISVYSSVFVNLIKSYVKICGLYFGSALLIQRLFALLRFKSKMR
ncbi:hypothetical protein [Rhizobium leguminosarum]|uniref:hypothetical protein n=1 Tax=Rhizobium leguminosarum TaxID=384 RepID=UPI0009B7B3D7|nr:hypothetical protein [Rhizobium leguminosarum]